MCACDCVCVCVCVHVCVCMPTSFLPLPPLCLGVDGGCVCCSRDSTSGGFLGRADPMLLSQSSRRPLTWGHTLSQNMYLRGEGQGRGEVERWRGGFADEMNEGHCMQCLEH